MNKKKKKEEKKINYRSFHPKEYFFGFER